ncbi:uncharacterized protein [Palaemon carinicauda]|uniref:uncharacterized protein n=1 Tax=Palaemon carinicauda TaxID=392227 RepID=UPI0035B65FAF
MLSFTKHFSYLNNGSDRQHKNNFSFFILFIVFLQLRPLSLIYGANATPQAVLVHDDCPKTMEVIANYNQASLRNDLVSLPCGPQDPPTSTLTTLSSKAAENRTFFIVVATCDTVKSLSSPLRSPIVLPRERTIPVSASGQRCHSRKKGCSALGEPLRDVLNLAACWMTYNVWSQVVILYDHTMDMQANKDLVRNFLNYCFMHRFKLSFINMKKEIVDRRSSKEHLDGFIEAALSNWDSIDARHTIVIAESPSVSALLKKIPHLNNGRNQSSYEWLMITSVNNDIIDAWTPINGHQVYFADAPLKNLSVTLSNALRTGEAMARANYKCSDVPKHSRLRLPSIAISVKPPDYSSTLIPSVVIPHRGPPLVATHTYMPSLGGIGGVGGRLNDVGRLRLHSPNEEYQLYGAHLLVATLSGEPFIRALDTINLNSQDPEAIRSIKRTANQLPLPSYANCSQYEGFEGFLVDLLNILSVEMNFTYSIYEVCDKSYGSNINGTWTGTVGEVVYGRAHIGLGNLGANYARSLAVSFPIISTSHGGAGIIFRRPPEMANDLLSVFLLPFSLKVWICILVIIPVCAFALHLTMLPRKQIYNLLKVKPPGVFPERLEEVHQWPIKTLIYSEKEKIQPLQVNTTSHQLKNQDTFNDETGISVKTENKENDNHDGSFSDSMWFAATVLMQQGQDTVPESGPGRIVFGTAWIMAVVLYAAYTSNLVSFFTVNKMTLPFHNLDELVDSNYKFGTRTGSVYINNFEESGERYTRAYQKLMSFGNDVLMPSYEAGLRRTLEGNYAFIADYVVLDYYQMKDCNLILLKQQLFETKSSFILPKDSPLLPAVNHFMALVSESGIMEKLRSRWWRAEPCAEGLMVTSYDSINILEVSSALLIMAFGVVLAVTVCLCEYCKTRGKPHCKETKTGSNINLPLPQQKNADKMSFSSSSPYEKSDRKMGSLYLAGIE